MRLSSNHRCFVQYFTMLLLLCIAAFYATLLGVPQHIFMIEASHVTSLIALFFLYSVIRLGFLSWRLIDGDPHEVLRAAEWGPFATNTCTMLGLIGTVIGLSMEAETLAGGTAGLVALATALYSTVTGIGAGLIIMVFHHNLYTCAIVMARHDRRA